jgi:glycosyltransferase involved in cell wall biosynthesis
VSDVALTVLLPVFNGERYVGETIDSVRAQSYGDFEFLIVDDGSLDRTPDILRDYAQSDSRIRLLRHENHGVGYSLNRGLVEARGRLIAQIGADDIALPDRLKKQVDFLEEHPDYVLVGGYLRIIDAHGRAIGLRRYPTNDRRLRSVILVYNPFGAPSVMYRRTDALAAGGFTTRFATSEDYDFVLRLAKRGKVANLPEALTSYRLHGDAVKSTQTLRQLRDTLDAKRTACIEYGYRPSLGARAVNLALSLLAHLPGGAIYWLFTKIAIRRES